MSTMKKCTVIGGGAMGRQIALNTAIHGYQVVVCESFPAARESREAWKEDYLSGRIAKGRMTAEQVADNKARFTVTDDQTYIVPAFSILGRCESFEKLQYIINLNHYFTKFL